MSRERVSWACASARGLPRVPIFWLSIKPSPSRQALRPQMDAVFLPRPIWRVERLPRNEASKLPRKALQALHEQLAATRKAAP